MKDFITPRARTIRSERIPTLQTKQIIECDGEIEKITVVTERIEPYKVNEGLTVRDFDLMKLMRNGSVDLLKENSTIQMSNLKVADTVAEFEK